MQFTPNALRFSPASVGALIDPSFLRHVLDDVEAPTHPDAALARPHRPHWQAPLAVLAIVVLHWAVLLGWAGAPGGEL